MLLGRDETAQSPGFYRPAASFSIRWAWRISWPGLEADAGWAVMGHGWSSLRETKSSNGASTKRRVAVVRITDPMAAVGDQRGRHEDAAALLWFRRVASANFLVRDNRDRIPAITCRSRIFSAATSAAWALTVRLRWIGKPRPPICAIAIAVARLGPTVSIGLETRAGCGRRRLGGEHRPTEPSQLEGSKSVACGSSSTGGRRKVGALGEAPNGHWEFLNAKKKARGSPRGLQPCVG